MTLATTAMLSLMSLHTHATSNNIESNWEKVRHANERSEVATWVRPVPGNPLKAFKGEVEVPHSMLTVLAVLGDVERFPQWVYQCNHARLMPEFGHDISYLHIAGLWPVKDRDIVARTEIVQDPDTLAIDLHTVTVENLYPKQKNTVRLPALDNRFILTPLNDGWTRITFETFVNPGGSIPAWLANLVAIRAPLDTLEGMSELMSEGKYQITDSKNLPAQFSQLTSMKFPTQKDTTSASAKTEADQ